MHWTKMKIAVLVLLSISTILFAADTPQVTGKYLGNNKEAKLVYGLALPIDPWQGEPAYQIVLTEKDPSKADKPEFDALFRKLGHALLMKVTKSGKIIGSEICHQDLERSGVSQVGVLNVEKFKIEGNTISGRFFTKGPAEIFDETWECDLTLAVPIKTK
jgi:hypothetical protein